MTHALLLAYGVYKKMDVYRPHRADYQELTQFHSTDYIDFLKKITPENSKDFLNQLHKYNLGAYTDCPVFDGLYDFCQMYAGGSIDGAMKLNHGLADIAINWAGGLHHAKKSEASGFCYVNDIVLGILELLKYHPRVVYIDIDIHHGDGVEEAFYTTDRVMTVSFHKYGDYFPGTGKLEDIGVERGKRYAVNFPLADGIDDKSFLSVFKPVMSKVMEVYRPTAIVLQCGADSLTGDRLGVFNLTTKGHGEAVRFMKTFGLPMLVLGGGGYNIRSVSRCWAYETTVLTDYPVNNYLPYNEYFQYYGPDFRLHLTPADVPNLNAKEQLEKIKLKIFQNLSEIEHAPSVQMQQVPPDMFLSDEPEDDSAAAADTKGGGKMYKVKDEDFFDGDDDHNVGSSAFVAPTMSSSVKREREREELAQLTAPDSLMAARAAAESESADKITYRYSY